MFTSLDSYTVLVFLSISVAFNYHKFEWTFQTHIDKDYTTIVFYIDQPLLYEVVLV